MTVDPDLLFAQEYDSDRPDFTGVPVVASPEISHKLRNEMIAVVVTAAIAIKMMDWKPQSQKWQDNGWDGPSFRKDISGPFGNTISRAMVPILIAGAMEGRRKAQAHLRQPLTQGDWMRVVRPWAETYASTLGTDLASTSEQAVRESLQDFVNRKMGPTTVVSKLKDIFGLDQRSAKAYLALADKPGKGMDMKEIGSQYLQKRAELIADVNTMTAFNFGRQLMFKQAMVEGQMDKDERKVWVTAIDERTCETCAPMDGVSVPMMDAFTVLMPVPKTFKGKGRPTQDLIVPPVHPNCRCTIVPESTFKEGIITRTARFDDDGEPHHLARQVSDIGDLIFGKRAYKSFDPNEKRGADGKWVKTKGAHAEWAEYLNAQPKTRVQPLLESLMVGPPEDRMEAFRDFTEKYGDVSRMKNGKTRKVKFTEPLKNGSTTLVTDVNNWLPQNDLKNFVLGANTWFSFAGVKQARAIENGSIEEARDWKYKVLMKTRKEPQLRALIDVLDSAPHNAPTLYRGIRFDQEEFDDLKVGGQFDTPLSSWAADHDVGLRFGGKADKSSVLDRLSRSKDFVPVVMELEPGSKSLNIDPVGMNNMSSNEWISRGKYQITHIDKEPTRGRLDEEGMNVDMVYHTVRVKQVGYTPQKTIAKAADLNDTIWTAVLTTSLPHVEDEIEKKYNPKQERDEEGRWTVAQAKIDADVKQWLTDERKGQKVQTGIAFIRDNYDTKSTKTPFGKVYDKYAKDSDTPVYRGFARSDDMTEEKLKTGKTMTMKLASFSTSPDVAKAFALMRSRQGGGEPTVIRVLPGASGLDLTPLYNSKTDTFHTHRRKKEWVMNGKYRVLATHHEKNIRIIEVRQIKTRDQA